MKRVWSWILVLWVAGFFPAMADRDSSLPDWRDGNLTFYLDNDLFSGTDQNYTNGARLSWISGERPVSDLGSMQRLLRRLSGDAESFELVKRLTGFEDPNNVSYNFGFSLTQLMFTPEDNEFHGQPPGERPYAGWRGVGFSLHAMDDRVLNSAQLSFGVVGPAALGEETQDIVHDIRHIDKFNGWDSQVPNEPTVGLYFGQKRRLDLHRREWDEGAFRVDALSDWGVALGNFRTGFDAGLFVRAGYNLPANFSDPRLSETAYSHRYFRDSVEAEGRFSVYALFGTRGRLSLYDATLDGPLFRDFDTEVDKELLVGEVFAGFGLRWSRVELSYVHAFQTNNFDGQDGGQQFGSLALRVAF